MHFKRLVDQGARAARSPHEGVASRRGQARGPAGSSAAGPEPGAAQPAPAQPGAAQPAPAQSPAAAGQMGAKHLLIMYAGSLRAPARIVRTRDEARALAEQVLEESAAGGEVRGPGGPVQRRAGAGRTRGGDLGTFRKGMMVPEFEQAVENLAVGAMSGVVETPFGFHIILRTHSERARAPAGGGSAHVGSSKVEPPGSSPGWIGCGTGIRSRGERRMAWRRARRSGPFSAMARLDIGGPPATGDTRRPFSERTGSSRGAPPAVRRRDFRTGPILLAGPG